MLDLNDKISNVLNKYDWDYKDININILSKNDKSICYNISIKYNNNTLKSKRYRKFLVPYNRKVKINETSINNLKYTKNLKTQIKDNVNTSVKINLSESINENVINSNILKDTIIIDKNINNNDIKCSISKKCKNEDCKYINTTNSEYCYSCNDKEKCNNLIISDSNINKFVYDNSENTELDKNNDNYFIDADLLFNEEIDISKCDDCKFMDNNILYLCNRLKNVYLDIIKEYDNIVDNTYYVNTNLEELINLQNVKDKEIKMNIFNIIQNKNKLNKNEISMINNILTESVHDMPHISPIFRNKIVDPLIENLRYVKNQYNEFINLIS